LFARPQAARTTTVGPKPRWTQVSVDPYPNPNHNHNPNHNPNNAQAIGRGSAPWLEGFRRLLQAKVGAEAYVQMLDNKAGIVTSSDSN